MAHDLTCTIPFRGSRCECRPPVPDPHELTAARGLPVLADKGAGASVCVHMPVKHQPNGPLHTDKRTW